MPYTTQYSEIAGVWQVKEINKPGIILWTAREHIAKWVCDSLNLIERHIFIVPQEAT